MKRTFILLSLIALFGSCSYQGADSAVLFPYWDKLGFFLSKFKYKAGYIDLSGRKVITSKYVEAMPFTGGLGCVGIPTDSGVFFGYIDSAANYIIQPRFADARPFQNGRACVRQYYNSGGWAVINRQGELITDNVFSFLTDYHDGYCIGWIRQGTEEATRFESAMTGIATLGLLPAPDHVYYNCYKIDTDGKATLIEAGTEDKTQGNYHYTRSQNNLAMFWTADNKFGFKKITPAEFETGKMNYRDEGSIFIEPEYKSVENFQHGFARVQFENGDKGYIDTTGKTVLRFKEDRPY